MDRDRHRTSNMRRGSGPRLARVARLLGAIGFTAVLVAAPQAASAVPQVALPAGDNLSSVTVDDTAGVLNEDKLRDVLDAIDFNEPTDVAVYTRKGEYADNINTETLLYAREHHPEWISDDPEDYGDYWADDLFIITLSVEGDGHGQVGTYFGENRKVSDDLMEAMHEAGFEDFKQARWTDGVIAVAEHGADVMNRPWHEQPAVRWAAGLGVAAAGALGGAYVWLRSDRRAKFANELELGRRHLTRVTTDLDETEIAARTLPMGSRHAAELERRFADFMDRYRSSFREQQELEAADTGLRSSSRGVKRATTFRDVVEDLDYTDDAIIQAAALYTRSATWEDAWRAQTAPLLADLDKLPSLAEDSRAESMAAAAALTSFGSDARTQVEAIGTDLSAQAIDVDTALDRLAGLRKQLTERLDAYAAAQIEAFAKSSGEEREMRAQLRESRYEYAERARRQGSGSILDVISPSGIFWRAEAFSVGYRSGRSSVESSRRAAASASARGISHGYSGGGGSFSGSGGSSRF